MVLADTSSWIDHLRDGSGILGQLLRTGRVFTHEYVIGELACGSLHNRSGTLKLLGNLPRSVKASHQEVLYLIERHKLNSRGMGYVDMALLASSSISSLPILTRDKKLAEAAEELGRLYVPASFESK
jgi:predicted nucleic acid-binding protein